MTAIKAQASDNARRDWMAFGLVVFVLALSGFFAWERLPWLAGGTVLSLAGYIFWGFFKWRKK